MWAIIVLLAVLELNWLGWVLEIPLPNSPGIRRSFFLWRFLPEVVPGVTLRDSNLGTALRELGHVENLPQRIPIVLATGYIAASGLAIGALVLRAVGLRWRWTRLERLAVGFGLGMTGLGLLALGSGRLGLLGPWSARIGLLVPILVEAALLGVERSRRGLRGGDGSILPDPPVTRASVVGLFLVIGPFLAIMALAAMLPTIDFDAIEYHLQGPKEYFLAGRITFLPHNVYTNMPFGVEMLHLLGMHVMGDWWWGALVGQLLVAGFAPMAGLAVWLTALRWGSPRAAWVAAAVYLTTPWIYRLAAIPYVEGPLCYYHAALVWAAGMAWSAPAEDRARAWAVVGGLAGGAMAIKYPALISAVVPFGAVAIAAGLRSRSSRVVFAFGIGAAVAVGPWLVKNVADTGNPVYPLGYAVFGGRDWDAERQAKWENAHGRKPVETKAFVEAVVDVAGRSDWQSPALAALAPLALLRRGSRRAAGWIGGYVLYLFLTWWLLTHRLDRFWLPLLPGLAVLAGLGADWSRGKAWTALLAFVLSASIATTAAHCTTALVALNEWTGDLNAMRTGVPRMLDPALARLDDELPPGAKPLIVGQAAVFHLGRPIVYNTVFDRETFETIDRGHSPEEVRAGLARLGISHVYVDWFQIDRFRSPGNYGFTDHVTPDRLGRLVRAGVLSKPRALGPRRDLYTVLPPR